MTYKCPKCNWNEFSLGELGSNVGLISMMKGSISVFTSLTCTECGYTEFYEGSPERFRHRHNLGPGRIHGDGEEGES